MERRGFRTFETHAGIQEGYLEVGKCKGEGGSRFSSENEDINTVGSSGQLQPLIPDALNVVHYIIRVKGRAGGTYRVKDETWL